MLTHRAVDASQVPLDAERDDLALLQLLQFRGATVGVGMVQPFHAYVATLPATAARAVGIARPRAGRVHFRVIESTQEEFPWLTPEDFGVAAVKFRAARTRGWFATRVEA